MTYETIQNENQNTNTHIYNTQTHKTLCGRKTPPEHWKRYWPNQTPQLTQIDCSTCKNKYEQEIKKENH